MKKITFHRNPAERTILEKIARRFILPPHGPRSLPLGSWGVRDEKLKRRFPIRFFVWDTIPDFYRYSIRNRYRGAKNWVRFRTWDRYDLIRMEISKDYHDPDYRMLHANFQILKDFVEIELAAMQSIDSRGDEDVSTFLKKFGKHFRRFKRKNIRNGELGLEHLKWEIEETSGHQQISALEKRNLYLWWTQERPLRADPYESPLFHDPLAAMDLKSMFQGPHNRALMKARSALEAFYEAEDEEMLIRLMKIRRSLWT